MASKQLQELFKKASSLITTLGKDEDLITDLQQVNDRKDDLREMEREIPLLAREGNTEKIGIYLGALERFDATPDIRKILHYFAQSEAVRGSAVATAGSPDEIKTILSHISDAFTLANEIDQALELE